MSRSAEKMPETLSFRVPGWIYKSLNEIAAADRRDLSDVARALLERGLAVHQRDGQLFESAADSVTVPVVEANDEKSAKGKQRKRG